MRVGVIAVLVVGLAGGRVAAQPVDGGAAAEAAFADGQQRYAAGDYAGAAANFEAAYALDPDPVYLFNIAQAHRLATACAEASTYYRRFLDAVADPPNLARVQQYLEQTDACAKARDPVVPAAPVVTAPAVAPPVPERPPPSDPGRLRRSIGIGGIVLGGIGLGAGIYFSIETSRLAGRLEDLCQGTIQSPCAWTAGDDHEERRLEERHASASTRAAITYGVGGAAVLGGIALYVLSRSAERPSVAVVPTSGGAVAVGGFAF